MTRMTSDIENLQQLLQDGLAQFAVQGLTMIVITIVLFTMNVKLDADHARARRAGADRRRRCGSARHPSVAMTGSATGSRTCSRDLSESLHGVRTVAAHNRQAFNIVQHRNVVGDYRSARTTTPRRSTRSTVPGTQLLGYLAQAALLAIGGDMVLHHQLSIGALRRVLPLPEPLLRADPAARAAVQHAPAGPGVGVQAAHAARARAEHAASAAGRVRAAADRGGDRLRPRDASATTRRSRCSATSTCGSAPGETVAFVGTTGAGKSTIAKLITRFYDPTDGRVLIDGHDLRSVTLDSLRRQLGVVPAGAVPVRRQPALQHRLRAPGRDRRGGVGGGQRRRPRRRGRADARRPRHGRARARAVAVLRRAAADRARARVPRAARACSCSTRRPPTSTCSPRRRSRRRSTCCCEARTAVLSPTA